MTSPDASPPPSFIEQVRQTYLNSRKQRDIFWNTYIARPLAAPMVLLLAKTPITPNQVTLLGAVVFLIALAPVVFWTHDGLGLVIAALLIELAYLFDCADGQLARLTKMTSGVGAYLDFLIDEFKALGLVAAFSARLWLTHGMHWQWLLVGMGGTCLVAVATSLTTFVRRPEYAGQEVKPGVKQDKPIPKSIIGKLVWLAERVAQWLIHYPSWILYLAILDALELIPGAQLFLILFLGVYALYAAKTGLAIVLRLGRRSFYDTPA